MLAVTFFCSFVIFPFNYEIGPNILYHPTFLGVVRKQTNLLGQEKNLKFLNCQSLRLKLYLFTY